MEINRRTKNVWKINLKCFKVCHSVSINHVDCPIIMFCIFPLFCIRYWFIIQAMLNKGFLPGAWYL